MRPLNLLLVGVSLFLIGCQAEDGDDSIPPAEFAACISEANSDAKAGLNVVYDEFADLTLISAGNVPGNRSTRLSAFALYRCAGENICRSDSVRFGLYRFGGERALRDSLQITFLLDDTTRIRFGPLEYRSAVEDGGTAQEVVHGKVDVEAFQRIACADIVRFQVGPLESHLTLPERNQFRYLAAVLGGEFPLDSLREGSGE